MQKFSNPLNSSTVKLIDIEEEDKNDFFREDLLRDKNCDYNTRYRKVTKFFFFLIIELESKADEYTINK